MFGKSHSTTRKEQMLCTVQEIPYEARKYQMLCTVLFPYSQPSRLHDLDHTGVGRPSGIIERGWPEEPAHGDDEGCSNICVKSYSELCGTSFAINNVQRIIYCCVALVRSNNILMYSQYLHPPSPQLIPFGL